jgi:Fur family transcriptional regulator, stress-responsive regulator
LTRSSECGYHRDMIDRQNERLIERLRIAGLRVTSPRIAVLEALGTRSHIDAETIAAAARERLGTLSAQAVYDILHAFAEAGLVRRIEPAGSPAVYETRVGDNHHHIVCRICGSIADVDCTIGEAPCLTPSSASGYIVDEAEITFWGICPNCQ